MKRDFLTNELGLSKEITDKIMAQYGESVNKLKSENSELAEKISSYEQKKINYAAMEESISTLTAEKEKLLKDYEKLSKDFSNSKLSGAIADALSSAGAKNLKAAEALIDKNLIKAEESGFTGISEQIEKIKEECDYLFYDTSLSSGMRHSPMPTNEDGFTHFARAGAKLQ